MQSSVTSIRGIRLPAYRSASSCWARGQRSLSSSAEQIDRKHYDVVMAGGGIMGCASAYFLAKRINPDRICVVERDPSYKCASSALAVGGVRYQFSCPENVQLSMFFMDFLKTLQRELQVPWQDPPDVQFVESGYLFLASAAGTETLLENHAVQKSFDAHVKLMTKAELKAKFPWLNVDDVELGSLGLKNEGWLDPWSLLRAFRAKAISMGVQFIAGNITAVQTANQAVGGVSIDHDDTNGVSNVTCDYLVNTAGPHAADIAAMAGIGEPKPDGSEAVQKTSSADEIMSVPLPVRPRRRCVYSFQQREGPVTDCPLLVDMSGAYVRREGNSGLFLGGMCPPREEDLDGLELSVDYDFFDNRLWPLLARRVPVFEGLKMQNPWAGYYDYNTLDQNGIIGRHPVLSNFLFANGFSGHGLQQGAAVGRAISEIVCDSKSHSIDLTRLGFERIVQNEPYSEKNVV